MVASLGVHLEPVTRHDVQRMADWLDDPELAASWYGRDESGASIHISYQPRALLAASQEDWWRVFTAKERRIYSVYAGSEHIGEIQIHLDLPLKNAEVLVLIGKRDLWRHGYGSAALARALDMVFGDLKMHRAWVDIPEYNEPARHMCEQLGFVLEGRLRASRSKEGRWYDSMVMGLLADEYVRRKAAGRLPS